MKATPLEKILFGLVVALIVMAIVLPFVPDFLLTLS